MTYRDLLPERLGGRFIASHITIADGGPVPDYVHHHDIRFQVIHCVRGWVRVVYEDQGPPFVLAGRRHRAAAAAHPPPRARELAGAGGASRSARRPSTRRSSSTTSTLPTGDRRARPRLRRPALRAPRAGRRRRGRRGGAPGSRPPTPASARRPTASPACAPCGRRLPGQRSDAGAPRRRAGAVVRRGRVGAMLHLDDEFRPFARRRRRRRPGRRDVQPRRLHSPTCASSRSRSRLISRARAPPTPAGDAARRPGDQHDPRVRRRRRARRPATSGGDDRRQRRAPGAPTAIAASR